MSQQSNPLLEAILSSLLAGNSSQNLMPPSNQASAPSSNVDLGRIDINKQFPQSQDYIQPMVMPQQTMQPQRPQPQLDENGQTAIGRFLSQLGIPLATAAVGLAGGGNGITAGAAGFQGGYTAEKQQQHKDKMEQKKLDFERKRIEIQDRKEERLLQSQLKQQELLQSFMGGQGQGSNPNVPVGTTLRIGGMTVPLNAEMDDTQRKILAATPNIVSAVDEIGSLIDSGIAKGDSNIERLMIDSGQSILVGGDAEKLQSKLNYLKSVVTFSEAGKTLTDNEKDIFFRLLNTFGKDDATIKENLGYFKDRFEKLDALIRYGQNNPNVPQNVLDEARKKIIGKAPKNLSEDNNSEDEYQKYLNAIGAQ